VILTSYEADFAASWGRQVRNLAQASIDDVSFRLSQDSTAANRWHTTEGGGMVTAGIRGPILGRGGDLLIIDDPVKSDEEAQSPTIRQHNIDWWQTTASSRLEPGGSVIVLMQRWHQMDLAGFLLSTENEDYSAWEDIRLPAIAEVGDPLGRRVGEPLCPERYDADALAERRRLSGSRAWTALYQQRPSAQEGEIIKRAWIKRYTQLPERLEEQIISVDATFTGKATSDFVAIQVWGRHGAKKYGMHRIKKRMGITDTIRELLEISERFPKATLKLIENKANGPAIEDLLKTKVSGIVLWEPQGDKISRMNAVAPQFEAGNVEVPEGSSWDEWVDEITTFPNAATDDESDATSMALIRLEENVSRGAGVMRVVR
jgi:predicted phage terminase large subunit-like protein